MKQVRRTAFFRNHLAALGLLGCLCALMLFAYSTIDASSADYRGWDLWAYKAIASQAPGLSDHVPKPFAYRLLGPYVAGLLPLDENHAFRALTVMTAFCLVVLLYLFFAVGSRVSAATACLLTAAFLLNKNLFGVLVWNYFAINDLLSLVLLVIAWCAMKAHHWWGFGATLLVLCVTREVWILMVPVAVIFLWKNQARRREYAELIVSVLPALLVFAAVRLLVPVDGGPTFLEAFQWNCGKALSLRTWYRLIVRAWIPFSLLPFLWPKRLAAFAKQQPYSIAFVLLVFASVFFGTDNERLVAAASLIYYSFLGLTIDERLENTSFGILALCVAGVATLDPVIGRLKLPATGVHLAIEFCAVSTVTVLAAVLARRRQELAPRFTA